MRSYVPEMKKKRKIIPVLIKTLKQRAEGCGERGLEEWSFHKANGSRSRQSIPTTPFLHTAFSFFGFPASLLLLLATLQSKSLTFFRFFILFPKAHSFLHFFFSSFCLCVPVFIIYPSLSLSLSLKCYLTFTPEVILLKAFSSFFCFSVIDFWKSG